MNTNTGTNDSTYTPYTKENITIKGRRVELSVSESDIERIVRVNISSVTDIATQSQLNITPSNIDPNIIDGVIGFYTVQGRRSVEVRVNGDLL